MPRPPRLQDLKCLGRVQCAELFSGRSRIDLRLRPTGEALIIEVNPNISIARDGDFAQAAAKAGIDYESLISRILSLSGV